MKHIFPSVLQFFSQKLGQISNLRKRGRRPFSPWVGGSEKERPWLVSDGRRKEKDEQSNTSSHHRSRAKKEKEEKEITTERIFFHLPTDRSPLPLFPDSRHSISPTFFFFSSSFLLFLFPLLYFFSSLPSSSLLCCFPNQGEKSPDTSFFPFAFAAFSFLPKSKGNSLLGFGSRRLVPAPFFPLPFCPTLHRLQPLSLRPLGDGWGAGSVSI